MKKFAVVLFLASIIGLTTFFTKVETPPKIEDRRLLTHIVDPSEGNLKFYWKNKSGERYANFKNIRSALQEEKDEVLIFAMNGGMYTRDFSPQGLFIENGKVHNGLNRKDGKGNFYMHPNGVFYLTKNNEPVICKTSDFKVSKEINYATQSGPMLLIDGNIHPKFTDGSENLHIRNGVGILPSGKLLFAMSKEKINFFDFASFFKKNGCKNALYLDGFVSRTYLPNSYWEQLDGNFGVIIAEAKTF